LSDLIAAVEGLVPSQILFPDQLLCQPGDYGYAPNTTCLRSCTALNFTSWYDPIAFAVCDTDPISCDRLPNWRIGVGFLDNQWQSFGDSLQGFKASMQDPAFNPAGYRLCTWVTWIAAVPPLAVAVSVLSLAGATIITIVEIIPNVVETFCHMFVFFITKS
jgi:hypothetical protein